jgi:hypothetical protein
MPHALLFPLLFITQVLWLLVIGFGIAIWLCRKRQIDRLYIVPIAGLIGCLLAYVAFWAYFSGRTLGEVYSWSIALVGLATSIGLLATERSRKLLLAFDVLIPFCLWCSVAFLFTSLTFGCHSTLPASSPNQLPFCYVSNSTTDNIIPQFFASNVYNGHPKTMFGDWHSSDRPPLQAGVVLLEAPITELHSGSTMSYELLATFLQVLWVPVIWVLARRLGLSGEQLTLTFILCLSAGFFLFNSVFVWPKLLAAALGGIGLCLVLFEKPTLTRWILAGAALGAAMLSHGGVDFTLLPLFIIIFTRRHFPGWRILLAGGVTVLILMTPWLLYQHFYDPPGNRLLKWQIAGVIPVDNNSFTHDLIHSYSHAGVKGTLDNKLDNAYTIFYWPSSLTASSPNVRSNLAVTLRSLEFYYVFFGLGFMNFGWLGLILPRARKRIIESGIDMQRLKLIFTIAAASLVMWILVMFGPGTTIIHQGSYLTMMLLFVGLAAIISTFPSLLKWAVAALKLVVFLLLWVVAIYAHHSLSGPYILWSILAACLVSYILFYIGNYRITASSD